MTAKFMTFNSHMDAERRAKESEMKDEKRKQAGYLHLNLASYRRQVLEIRYEKGAVVCAER